MQKSKENRKQQKSFKKNESGHNIFSNVTWAQKLVFFEPYITVSDFKNKL